MVGGASLIPMARLVQVLQFGCCCLNVDAGAMAWVSQQRCRGASAMVWVLVLWCDSQCCSVDPEAMTCVLCGSQCQNVGPGATK